MDKKRTENSIQDKGGNRDEYAIYEYLKFHPGVLISGISAIVMIITFVINYAIYLRTSIFLAYWGTDLLNVNMNNVNFVYMFVGAFIYYMMIMFIQPFIINSCEKFVEEMKSDYYISCFRKHIKKEVAQYKKILNIKKRDKKFSYKLDEEYIKIERYLGEINKNIKESKKLSKKITKKVSRKLVISIIIAFLGLTVAIIILILFSIKSFGIMNILLISIICASLTLAITMVIVYFLLKWPLNKKIKKELSENKWELEPILKMEDFVSCEYPIDKILNLDCKELFRDKSLISLFLQIALGTIFLILLVYPSSVNDTKNKQEFAIVTEDGQDYVIIYNNDNCYYLIEAVIEDEKITIDTTKQSVVVQDRIVYENIKFQEVVKKTLDEKYD